MKGNIVEMSQIEKSFGTNKVLKKVDFKLKVGEIHALLGENGTGKTTLMNILGGVIDYDEGQITINGKTITRGRSGQQELSKEISFIHQELSVIKDLNIYQNLFLGNEIKKGIFLDKNKMCEISKTTLERLEVSLDPEEIVGNLDASHQQIIEISKGLLEDNKVLIMDEPTSSLTDIEIHELFKTLRNLKKQNISIIFISHKLNEVVEICDSYTILRDGVVVKEGLIGEDISENELARHMIGRELASEEIYYPRAIGDLLLETKNLSKDREFQDVNMNIKKGEIVGVTGLLGDGRSSLFEVIYGYKHNYAGEIIFKNKLLHRHSTTKAIDMGIAYVPRNRKTNGIIKDLNIGNNMNVSIINKLKKVLLINKVMEKSNIDFYRKDLNIKMESISDLITKLSGGNQQKVILSRALGVKPDLVILDNPTQGVDIGAKFEIYELILDLAKEGISFFVLSSEAPEIMMLCDRTYVMFHGEVRAELQRAEFCEERIMTLATGGN